jgi:hypothetical protein
MRQLLTKLRPLVAGGTAAVGALRKRLGDLRSEDNANRLTALVKGFEIQNELNATMDVQITVLQVHNWSSCVGPCNFCSSP